jgi:glucose/arabinose dehydrogenase
MRTLGFAVIAIAVLACAAVPAGAISVPSQFVVDVVGSGFDTPTAIAFLPGGRMLVAEKRGRVYSLLNGVRSSNPMWSRENEVLNVADRGLLGLAIDPNYVTNRYVYLMYTVDPDSNGTDNNNDAFGRIVRYQVSASDSNTFDASSRTVLLGVSWRYGPLSASPSHTIGTLRFGSDGSLLASMGDGASFSEIDDGGLDGPAFGSGANKTDPFEDIGAFRAQSLTSLCGKILRINPANGQGYPSNPYWDGNATSIRSRVWAYGLRNPFRFGVRLSQGSTNPADGDPGTVYIGDVGFNTWEDQNVVRTPGANFGWPCYEGMGPQSSYQAANPAHNGCGSIGTSDNPASHTPPTATWHHSNASQSVPAGAVGNAAVGGCFYTGTQYPGAYRGYFFADYGRSWIRVANYNASDQLVSITSFGTEMDAPVDLITNPVGGDVYYVAIEAGEVRRIRYTGAGGGNTPPFAVASANPSVGVAPVTVAFSSAGSYDPDNEAFGVSWDFGDGTSSTQANPSHVYPGAGSYTAILTASDNRGGVGRDTAIVLVLGSSAFPTTPIVDTFDRANGPIGPSWSGGTGGFDIFSNSMRVLTADGSVVWNAASLGPNQEAYVTVKTLATSAVETDVLLKVQGLSWDTGCIEVWYDRAASAVRVVTYEVGGGWVDRGILNGVTLVNGDQFGARAMANGIVEVFRNGTKLGEVSVATWPHAQQGGRIGFYFVGAVNELVDDFGGGNITFVVNTPPTAIIDSPPDSMFFAEGDTIRLLGNGSDAEDTAAQLTYQWRMDLHHNTHVHPGSFVSSLRNDYYLGENHDDGTGIYEVVKLIVTDRGGLRDTSSVTIFPEVNLRPRDLTIVPWVTFAGMPTEYRFVLENTGRLPAPITHWTLHTEQQTIAEGDTLVPALSQVEVRRALVAPAGGNHTLRVVVDSLAALVEVDESDNAMMVEIGVATPSLSVGDLPAVLELSPARPNPTAGATRMTLALPTAAPVTFEVFDLQGRSVWRAPARTMEAGRWDLTWPGASGGGGPARPGIYLAVVHAGDQSFTRRIARLR